MGVSGWLSFGTSRLVLRKGKRVNWKTGVMNYKFISWSEENFMFR